MMIGGFPSWVVNDQISVPGPLPSMSQIRTSTLMIVEGGYAAEGENVTVGSEIETSGSAE